MADPRLARTLSNDLATPDPDVLEQTLQRAVQGRDRDASSTIGVSRVIAGAEPRAVGQVALKRLGYDIGPELGRGGLGTVLLARQQVFDREVAIKRLHSQDDRAAGLKFYAEAVVTALLEHPNIVPIHDLVSDDKGRLQLVMKRVEGSTWKKLLHPTGGAAGLPLDDHLDILVKVCEAVTFAHDKGIIHRDLKPENVMVGVHGEVLVMDWGCAVAYGDHEQHPAVPRVEEVNQISGTPSYMAPEMVLFDQRAIGPRSDVYLLGSILYEILTGLKPHTGDTVMQVLKAAAMDRVIPPQERVPHRDMPSELSDICMNALTHDPAQRIPTATAFLERLRAYRRHAEAVTLAQVAKGLLEESGDLDEEPGRQTQADDLLRRAVSAAENACELWQGWTAGHALAGRAMLAHARLCLATGGTTQAESLAQRALPHARAGKDSRTATAATSLAEQARRQAKTAQQRERAFGIMKWVALALSIVVLIGALVGLDIINGKRVEAESERQRADDSLVQLAKANAQAAGEHRRYAPGLVAQAKAAIASNQIADAATALEGALSFDPDLISALSLQANVLASLGRYDDAKPVVQHWLELKPGDQDATDLAAIIALAGNADHDVVAARASDLFIREQLPALALGGLKTNAQRLVAYKARIRLIAPDTVDYLFINDDGTLFFQWDKGLQKHTDLVDLSPIRGMPFHDLNLTLTAVSDLTPLAGMPLQSINVSQTKVRDLSPLLTCPLTRLDANSCPIDVDTLKGFHLTGMSAYNNQQIHRLDFLRGMPLTQLAVQGCAIEDLAPLTGLALTYLQVDGTFTSLEPLRGMPLKDFGINDNNITSLAPIDGNQLNSLGLGINNVVDLADLHAPLLKYLSFNATSFTDLHPLANLHPLQLSIAGYQNHVDISWVARIDASHLTEVDLGNLADVSLAGFAGMSLDHLNIAYCRSLDLSVFAKTRIANLALDQVTDDLWPQLAALKGNPRITRINWFRNDLPAAEFWKQYDPTKPPPRPAQ